MVSALETRRRALMFQPHRATASGAVASFRTDVVSPLPMEFDLVPIQDLHGQANPYPPGGGKNLFDIDGYLTDRSASYTKSGDTYTITTTTSLYMTHYVFSDTDEQVTISFGSFANGTTTNVRIDVLNTSGTVVKSIYPNTGTQTLTANKIRFNWSAQGNFTISKLQIERGSSATPYAPYSNICPITGHDGFTRTGTGKNLLPSSYSAYTIGNSYAYFLNAVPKGQTARLTFFDKDTTVDISGINMGFVYEGLNKVATHYRWAIVNGNVEVNTTNIESKSEYKCRNIFIYPKTEAAFNALFARYYIMVELGTNASSEFEQYSGVSYPTTFPTPPGTVYGGHVTDNGDGTGTLTVDKVSYTATTTNVVSTASTGIKYAQIGIGSNDSALPESDLQNDTISSEYQFRKNAPTTTGWFRIAGGTTLFIFDERFTNLDTAKAILASENPQFVYKLATPQTYTLSLTALQSLIGQNHVWVDNADSVAVEYWGH